jgi:hypothetical protein
MRLVIALLPLALFGCTSPMVVQERKSLLSDLTNCNAEEIATHRGRSGTWTASCKGVVYNCSGNPDVMCVEAPKQNN